MTKRRGSWSVWGIVAGFFLLAVVVVWLLRTEEPQRVTTQSTDTPATQFERPRLVGRYKGQVQWTFRAEMMESRGDEVIMHGLSDGVIYRDNQPYLNVTAATGIWHQKTNDLSLSGEVVAWYKDQMEFRTERLFWEAEREILTAPDPVYLTGRDGSLQAQQLEAAVKEERVTLSGGVQVAWQNAHWKTDKVVYHVDQERIELIGDLEAVIPVGAEVVPKAEGAG